MNRSRRRATVISWAIAAGVVYGGAGVADATPTPNDPGSASGPAGDSQAQAATGATAGPRRPQLRRSAPGPSPVAASGFRDRRNSGARPAPLPANDWADGGNGEEWPCNWWPVIRPIPPPEPAADPRGFVAVQDLGQMPMAAPAATFGAAIGSLGIGIGIGPAPIPGVPAPAPAAVSPDPAPNLPAAPVVAGPVASAPAAARSGPPARPPSVVAPPRRTDPVSAPAESVRPGYPSSLRQADIAQLATTALPGLAAIVGMTGLGALVGYRQARAGYLLRAAGVGRFLR